MSSHATDPGSITSSGEENGSKPIWLTIIWLIALMSIIHFLMVALSEEFLAFTPLPAAIVFGILPAIATQDMREVPQMLVMLVYVLIPLIAYAKTIPVLWVAIGGEVFMRLFMMAAAGRIIHVFLNAGILGIFGGMLGMVINSLYSLHPGYIHHLFHPRPRTSDHHATGNPDDAAVPETHRRSVAAGLGLLSILNALLPRPHPAPHHGRRPARMTVMSRLGRGTSWDMFILGGLVGPTQSPVLEVSTWLQ